ncbi:methyl-accepting chemotaxis protein [Vibrio parahaemolyticus]|uniref:methyl-accepting chemotaxis protein n=1 Tax=Vibrio parahaemolyticus TaxID=670 RepID=UPI0015BAE551|nr:methyl-accepting chemotaxis protein [Vibrio parahaemolyticus]QLE30524.1 methyl-accepting chemotaxis protein [Vibrio parahaemolyticus]
MSSSWYRRGTVTVTDGSKEVVGVGTLWVDAGNKPLAGDIMFIAGSIYEVESITDNEHLSLFRPFTGVPPANGEYAIIRNTSVTIATRVAAMVAAAINSKQVLLDDLRGYYTSTADKVLIHTDDGSTIEVVPLQTLVSDITNLIAQSESIKNDLANTQAALDLVRQYSNAAQGVEVEPGKYSAKSYAADAADTLALVNKAKSDVDLKASQVQQTKTDIEQFVSTSKTEIDAKATAISEAIDTQATTVKGEITALTSTSKQEITALATQSKKDITTLTTTSKSEISELVAGGTNSITSLADTSKGAINTLVSASKTEITDLATTEKAAISQQSTAAISEMTSLKQSAEQAASTATQKATQAAASATSAAQSKTDSQALKTQTEALANETKQVAEEIKSGSYVGWQIYCQSEANMKAARMLASEQFAASGFVHYGKHVADTASFTPINEGMFTNDGAEFYSQAGQLLMGELGGNKRGSSKTDFPVTHIAGFISKLLGVTTAQGANSFAIKFPEAPNGTVVYDSTGNCRGSGKATLDLTKDVDPKYGDVAGSVNEAVARAFEGYLPNGDFRNSTVGWVTTPSGDMTVASGEMTVTNLANNGSLRCTTHPTLPAGQWLLEATVKCPSGKVFWLNLYNPTDNNKPVIFTGTGNWQKVSGVVTTTVPTKASNIYIQNRSGAIQTFTVKDYRVAPASEEVVTNRVDMFGFEYFLEEISKANPFVYPYGCIQSKLTSIEGIATKESNRPITYYSVFDGDTTSKGKGVDFWAATDAQKRALVSNPDHNIYLLDDGRLVQWRVRQRTIAGVGNGDWQSVNSQGAALMFFQAPSGFTIQPSAQGILDVTPTWFGAGSKGAYYGITHATPIHKDNGIFCAGLGGKVVPELGIDGHCYFHVCGVVPRLNQGAYHPSFNPLGTKSWVQSGKGWNAQWWQMTGISSTRQCFDYKTASSDLTQAGANEEFSGFIGSRDGSSRPDGRFYDSIYASGWGGVIDYRFSAWDMGSKDEAAKIFQKLENGTYRGKEFATRCDLFVRTSTEPYFYGGKTAIWIEGIDDFIGSRNPRDFKVNGYTVVTAATDGHGQYVYFDSKYGDISSYWKSVSNNVVVTSPTNIPVSGNFNMIDVLGSPERIMAKTELANGWLGGWIPVVPNNTLVANKFPMTHVAVDKDLRMYWSDGDAAWQAGTYTFASSLNARDNSSAIPSTRVALHSYTASAKLTKSANIKPILNGANGVGDVYATMFNDRTRGGLLRESLINKVVSGYSQMHPHSQTVKLNKCTLLDGYFASNPDFSPTHECIALGEPAYDDSAIKVLWSQSSNNQQANLNLSFNELIWVGSYSSLNVTKITSTNTATDGVAGQFYLTDPSITNALGNKLLRCVKSFTASWGDVWLENGKGFVYITAPTGDPFLVVYGSQSDLWGDDGKLRIVSEVGTYKNLNGDLCLYGTHELAIPYGYTKNKARAGSQVSGVDL